MDARHTTTNKKRPPRVTGTTAKPVPTPLLGEKRVRTDPRRVADAHAFNGARSPALAYERGEEYGRAMRAAPDLLEAMSLVARVDGCPSGATSRS